jgi:hypothetical protein
VIETTWATCVGPVGFKPTLAPLSPSPCTGEGVSEVDCGVSTAGAGVGVASAAAELAAEAKGVGRVSIGSTTAFPALVDAHAARSAAVAISDSARRAARR